MTTALTVQDLDHEKIDLIKQTVARGVTDLELELFLHACRRTGLDPLMKQIHAIKRWDSRLQREAMAIQTGIDGYRLIADRTHNYAPGPKPTFIYDDKGQLTSAIAFIKKRTEDGTWHLVEGEAFWEEYVQLTKAGDVTSMWKKGHIMLAKCAEALALRKAFPAELSGVYTHEEMMQADNETRRPLRTGAEMLTELEHKKAQVEQTDTAQTDNDRGEAATSGPSGSANTDVSAPLSHAAADAAIAEQDVEQEYRQRFEKAIGTEANTIYKELQADSRLSTEAKARLYAPYTAALKTKKK